jgi:hypothetical protein
MRKIFRAYYPPQDEELEALWSDGVIVLDTNTLLNFFRYTPSTQDEFLSVLESLRESLWIPHQVGLEFQRSRLDVVRNTADAFSKIRGSVDSAKNTVQKTLNGYKHHPSLNRLELTTELDKVFERFASKLDAQEHEHEVWIAGDGDPGKTFGRISDLYEERVGKGFSRPELDQIEADGKQRYDDKVPPGFKDAGKSNGNQYGDLILWKEILRLGSSLKKPLIFVTDDAKEDWWRIDGGRAQGARTELIDEYFAASEQRLHLYEPLQFLKYAKERTQIAVSDNSLDEVQEVSNGHERALRVLQERRDQLVRLRDNELRNHDRHHEDDESIRRQRGLNAELDVLNEEQRFLEAQKQIIRDRERDLRAQDDELDPPFRDEEHMHQVAALVWEGAAIKERLAHLKKRSMVLKKGIDEFTPRDARADAAWIVRLRALDAELKEVSLALDDLER